MSTTLKLKNIKTFFFSLIAIFSFNFALSQHTEVTFNESSKQLGIDFNYNFGDYTYQNILESSGSGVTIFDYNGDGLMDIYFLNGTYLEGISEKEGKIFENSTNKLYKNNGNGSFSEVGEEAGLADQHWSMAAAAIDYDGDGDTDLYLLNYGPNIFFRNNGDGTFTDITTKLQLAGPEELNGFTTWSVGAVFLDYNSDGRLDIMVGNFLAFDPDYVSPTMPDMMPHPSEYKGQATLFYEQQANGRFKEISADLGLNYPDSKCMGLTVYDYDHDGDLDIFQGNDHQKNFLFRNSGSGHYTEAAVQSGVAVNDQGEVTGSMHGSIGDIDGDGLIDLLVTDLKYGAVYRNRGNGIYEDITVKSGVASAFQGKGQWAANFIDYDNDGDLDIFAANGTAEELKLQLPLLLENDGQGNFKDIGQTISPYFQTKRSGRGGAKADLDNDGDMDIIISHVDLLATPAVLINHGGNQNNWLGFELVGNFGPASAIGAQLIVHIQKEKQTFVNQWITSYLSNNDPRIHVGLGKTTMVDKIVVRWPNGGIQVFKNIEVNQYLRIFESKGLEKIEY